MKIRILVSFILWLCTLPFILLAWPCLAYMLRTDWDGRTYFFGNEKWGRATTHPSVPTTGYLSQLLWMAWRNPVYNLNSRILALSQKPYTLQDGDTGIGDKLKGGFYAIRMGWAWEYYWIKPYNFFGKRCIRARIGWKIYGNAADSKASFVFSFNAWKVYSGV